MKHSNLVRIDDRFVTELDALARQIPSMSRTAAANAVLALGLRAIGGDAKNLVGSR